MFRGKGWDNLTEVPNLTKLWKSPYWMLATPNAAATTAVFAPLHAQADPTAAWADAIYAINPGDDADLQKLRDWSLRFLDSGWAELATQHGWSAVEAWGIFPGSLDFARRRGDRQEPAETRAAGAEWPRGFLRPTAPIR